MESRPMLSNYARILLLIGQDPRLRVRDIAQLVDITDRAVQRLIEHLEMDSYISHVRVGRRNVYTVNTERSIDELGISVGELLAMVRPRHDSPRERALSVAPDSPSRTTKARE